MPHLLRLSLLSRPFRPYLLKVANVIKLVLKTSFVLTLAAAFGANSVAFAAGLSERRAALKNLISQHWEERLANIPELASMHGDKRYNDKVSDFSQEGIDADIRRSNEYLKKFLALDVTGLSEQERLNRDLMVNRLQREVDGARFKDWLMPLSQNSGVHIQYPQLAGVLSFSTVKDYEDYIARLQQLPRLFDQTIVQMQKGVKEGLMPPKILLDKIGGQCDKIAGAPLELSPYALPLKKFPANFSDADKARLTAALHAAITQKVVPAYQKLSNYVKNDYAPKGRTEVGIWALPDGPARYSFNAKNVTTTDMTPEQIHQLGLKEVARIAGEMQALAVKQGYKTWKEMDSAYKTNPDLFPKSRQEIVDLYVKYTNETYPKLSQLFGRLPKAKVEIKAIEEFREKNASGAQYQHPAADGSRPGIVSVNTGEFAQRSKIPMESIALHEGVPGHHMQIAIAQELPNLPEFRKHGGYTAYVEGWGLYAESLGRELGAYQQPYSYYGHLQAEMMRAIRLVVDTGLHYKKWSRQDVVDYFHANSGIDEVQVQSETDRYIAWPGQALGYKVGQLKIMELRAFAKEQLGSQFDIRQFHDVVLGSGSLPLDTLEKQVKNWVATQKTLAANGTPANTPANATSDAGNSTVNNVGKKPATLQSSN